MNPPRQLLRVQSAAAAATAAAAAVAERSARRGAAQRPTVAHAGQQTDACFVGMYGRHFMTRIAPNSIG